ncbi:MAG: OmpP1/FadL family transporter [Kiritimatiellia bacterium]
MKKLLALVASVLSLSASFGAGFGLYEASARGNALGGALVGSTKDASAVYYNPANMTEMTNVSVMVGATMLWLYSDVAVDGRSQRNMNPGVFCIPNFYFTTPVWGDLHFGLGVYCEDGLGTRYGDRWDLAGDTVKTTMEQFTLNPNLAYRITDWWSVAAGLKASYIYFYNRKHPYWGVPGYDLNSTLEGDDVSIGYNFGTTFRLFESSEYGRLSLGVVYRSQIKHHIEGDFDIGGRVGQYPYALLGGDTHSHASAKLTLPQSLTAGLNWDSPGNDWHVGLATTWTEWSCVDEINFKIPARKPTGEKSSFDLPLGWDNVWRSSVGVEYDLLADLALRCGYVYDMDPSSDHRGTTMLPGGDRHIVGLGTGYRLWRTLRLDIGYNLVMMDSGTRGITVNGVRRDFATDNAYSHMLSASLSYTF